MINIKSKAYGVFIFALSSHLLCLYISELYTVVCVEMICLTAIWAVNNSHPSIKHLTLILYKNVRGHITLRKGLSCVYGFKTNGSYSYFYFTCVSFSKAILPAHIPGYFYGAWKQDSLFQCPECVSETKIISMKLHSPQCNLQYKCHVLWFMFLGKLLINQIMPLDLLSHIQDWTSPPTLQSCIDSGIVEQLWKPSCGSNSRAWN